MIRKIGYIFSKRQKRNIVILLVVLFIGSFIELIGISSIMPLVTIITDETVLTDNSVYVEIGKLFHLNSAREFILLFILFLIAIYVLKNIYIIFQADLQYRFTFNNQRRLSKKMMDCYLKQNYLYHVSKNIAELQRNITSDVSAFYEVVFAVISFVSETSVCIMLLVYLLCVSFTFTFSIVILLGGCFSVFIFLYRKYSIVLGRQNREVSGVQTKWLLQAFTGIKEIKVMNKEEFFLNQYDMSYKKFISINRKYRLLSAMSKPIIETVSICGVLAVIAIRTALGGDLKPLVPILSVFVVAIFRLLPSFNRLSGCVNTIMFGHAAVDNIYQDLREIEELLRENENIDEMNFKFNLNEEIVLRDISFRYPSGNKEIVKNISLKIPPNKSIALIGPSGAGKTTLVDIILGILEPQCGVIEVAGESIFRHVRSWHRNIGYIPQMIYLMDDTIRSNVAFGIDESEIDDERVWEVLKEAQLEQFVRELPDGLYTEVGDRGMKLSGGQRQRIGIARALYTNPKLLVLDEATSALDNETEAAVMEAIDNLHGSHTMIIIAHRLTTIRNCDIIYEVNNQAVVKRNKSEVLS